MHPVVRLIGRVLRLVGISSPEDAAARKKTEAPSWKTAAGGKNITENRPEKRE
jgi:hypothetical protein